MDALEAFLLGLESLKERKVRTTLTSLGIIIGITAIVALIGVGEGLRVSAISTFESAGVNVITVLPYESTREMREGRMMTRRVSPIKLTLNDLSKIKRIKGVKLVTPVLISTAVLEKGREQVGAAIIGINFNHLTEFYPSLELESGTLPRRSSRVALVGYYIAHGEKKDFVKSGDRFKILFENGETGLFRVSGVLNKSGIFSILGTIDNQVFIPFNEARKTLKTKKEISSIYVLVEDPGEVDKVSLAIEEAFDNKVTAFSIKFIQEMVNTFLRTLNTVLGGISAISLFVAGIGIMNTMLISVMERTREIGVMKAIGAKKRDIMLIFISEAVLIGIIGSVIGVIVGIASSHLFGSVVSAMLFGGEAVEPYISVWLILLGLAFGVSVSVAFALFPAYKAAKLQPVEALRYE